MNKFPTVCSPRHVYKVFDLVHFENFRENSREDSSKFLSLEYLNADEMNPDPNVKSVVGKLEGAENSGTIVDASIKLAGTSVTLKGNDMHVLLSSCSQCILLAVTLGLGVDTLIRKTQLTDMSRALEYDAEANKTIEGYCDEINSRLRDEYLQRGLYLTDRFSPGYGDMPLAQTRDICSLLNTEKTVGIWVNDSDLMIPFKSITAVIGIADRPQPMRISGCGACALTPKCEYRKAGQKCG